MIFPEIIIENIRIPESSNEVCNIQLLFNKRRFLFEYSLDVDVYFQFWNWKDYSSKRLLHIGEIEVDFNMHHHSPGYRFGKHSFLLLLRIEDIEEILTEDQLNRKIAKFSDNPNEYLELKGRNSRVLIIRMFNGKF